MTNLIKILLVPFLLISFDSFANYEPLTREKIFELVQERLKSGSYPQEFVPGRDYYHFGYVTDLPRRQKSVKIDPAWKSEEIMYFANDKGKVTQIALIAKKCAVGEKTLEVQTEVKNQTKKFISRETKLIFGSALSIEDGAFKKAGPYKNKWVRVPVEHSLSGVRKVRLGRGLYKCDGSSGFGYRLDFFLE